MARYVRGEQLVVARQSVALAEGQAEIVRQQYVAGGGSQFDVVRAQAVVAQAQATLPPLEGERRAALFALADLLGKTPQNAPVTVENCVTAPQLGVVMPVGSGAALLQRRPDIREADRKFATALANQGVATADLFPRVTLNGLYGGASSAPHTLFSNSGLTWGIGPAISWSFPNLAGPLAALAQAKANVRAALAKFDSTTLQALNETEQALSVYGAGLNQRAALILAQRQAQHEYALAQDSFAAGQISNLDLLTSEQTVVQADTVVASSDAKLVQDQIAVFKALGGGWQ
jgi:outer membrane protein TolC